MQRTAFAIAAIAVAIAFVSLCGMHWDNCKEQQHAGNCTGMSLNCSPRGPWDSGMTFVMQWNDACKKLVFEGRPICHAKPAVRYGYCGGGRVEIVDPAPLISPALAADHPDEYSFDVQNIGNLDGLSDSTVHDGQIRYGMEWNDGRDAFVFHKLASPGPAADVYGNRFIDGLSDIVARINGSRDVP
jgi:hypothetical protein